MAADASYLPGIHRLHGGNTLEVSTGGTIDVFGALTLESGATLTNGGTIANTGAITNTGTITNSSDGQIREVVETKGAAGALTPYGVSVIGTTAGATAYTLAKPPAAGVRKTLVCKQSTGGLLVRCSSLCTLNYGSSRKITFAANADTYALELIATSATNWSAIRMSTAQVTTIVFGSS
jgi:hypothetical protein